MKSNTINWIFFDLGSTLVDESACEEYRLQKMLIQPGAPARTAFESALRRYALAMEPPFKKVASEFGLTLPKWPFHLEKLYTGVDEMLKSLSPMYHLGVIANQLPGMCERLAKFHILQYFDITVSSADEGIAKPEPEIFKRALKHADISPSQTLMVGDRPDNDILPAQKLGMHTLWLRQGLFSKSDPTVIGCHPDYIATDIKNATDILISLNQ